MKTMMNGLVASEKRAIVSLKHSGMQIFGRVGLGEQQK